jgi:hypothetical protein
VCRLDQSIVFSSNVLINCRVFIKFLVVNFILLDFSRFAVLDYHVAGLLNTPFEDTFEDLFFAFSAVFIVVIGCLQHLSSVRLLAAGQLTYFSGG